MDLFEILFILLFILFPILEQVLRRRKGQVEEPETGDEDAGVRDAGTTRSEAEPSSAADMVPDDLWAVLTGEDRSREEDAVAVKTEAPWSEPAEEPAKEREEPRLWERDERSWEPDRPPPPVAKGEIGDPVSLEYEGPEAYSLERTDFEAVSLEQPLPSPEERHRAFHALIDRPPQRRRRHRSAVGRALRDPERLRNAFVLAEVLGPPRGLTDR